MGAPGISVTDLVQTAEWHALALSGQRDGDLASLRKWLEEKLLPALRNLQTAHFELTMTDLDFGEELARRDRLVHSLLDLAEPDKHALMTFDASCDHLRSLILDWPQRIAFERSQVKRATLRQAAMDMEPATAELLNLRAEVDELRGQVAARDEALRLIRNAASDQVGGL